MRHEAEWTNGGESRRNEWVKWRADSFRGSRKATPSPVPTLNLRGSSRLKRRSGCRCLQRCSRAGDCGSLSRGQITGVDGAPQGDARCGFASRRGEAVTRRQLKLRLAALHSPHSFEGANEAGLARASRGTCSTRRPLGPHGGFRSSHAHVKNAKAFDEILSQRHAAFCRAGSGNRQHTRRWRLSQFYEQMVRAGMNGQSLVAAHQISAG